MAGEWSRASFSYDPGAGNTITMLVNAITNFAQQTGWVTFPATNKAITDTLYLRAPETVDTWVYRAEGPDQKCGFGVRTDVGLNRVYFFTFVARLGSAPTEIAYHSIDDAGAASLDLRRITVQLELATVTTILLIGGEHGLYVEAGSAGVNATLGHGMIATFDTLDPTTILHPLSRRVSQGLIMDFTGLSKFTQNRDFRFVSNDGTSKNFTAALQPMACRGITTFGVAPVGQPRFLVGAYDSMLGHGGSATGADIRIGATFGLINDREESVASPNDTVHYKVSSVVMLMDTTAYRVGASSSSASNNVAATFVDMFDLRRFRVLNRLTAMSHRLLPWQNVLDRRFSPNRTYRVARVDDAGRFAHIGIEWPSSQLTIFVS